MYLLVKMIKAALDKITSFREKALNTQDWSTLILRMKSKSDIAINFL